MKTLKQYIEAQHRTNKRAFEICAKLWDVSPATVYAYYYGTRAPSVEVTKRMIAESDGQLTFESIHGSAA